jgi:hypothetical protein
MSELLFRDEEAITRELKESREVAGKIENFISLIGNVREDITIDLNFIKEVIDGCERPRYLNSIMEVKQSENLLNDTMNELGASLSKAKMTFEDFFIDEAGKVIPKNEDEIIESHSYYLDSDEKIEYYEKVNAFVKARNELEQFLADRKIKNIESNEMSTKIPLTGSRSQVFCPLKVVFITTRSMNLIGGH